MNFFQQTNRRLILHSSRSTTVSALYYFKFSVARTKTDTSKGNSSGFSATANINQTESYNLKEQFISSPQTHSSSTVAANDLLEAKRLSNVTINDRTTSTVTSSKKFSTGLSPIQANSSIASTGSNLFHDTKVSTTPVAPGIPVDMNSTTSTSKEEEKPRKHEQIPSSGFSAFLRGIRSGLPFFPSLETRSTPIDIATTREYFIPLTRPSLIRLIATDSYFIDDADDRHLFHELCHGFDSAVVQHFHPILNELKHLFNPLNPDNETIDNRRISYRERLDNEYWLLQKINDLLHRANFTDLPRTILLNTFIHQPDSSLNVSVKIDGYDYDVLKFWILGREQMLMEEKPWWKKLLQRNKPIVSKDYFKRVIVAARLKGQDRLYLKAYRDIPLQNITQLLPMGKLEMGIFDRKRIGLALILGSGTFATHLITTMADYPLTGLITSGAGLSILLGLWSIKNMHTSKMTYLSQMNRLLFYKNVASNKQLLAMIVDRAEDELSKEVLLVYMFLQSKQKQNKALTKKNLELEIENWIRSKTNTDITFNSDQSIEFLRKLGILLPEDTTRPNCLHVVPYKQMIGILPQRSRTLCEKNEEWDLIEGYDRKYFELDWKTVLNEEKILRKSGWH